MSEVNLLLGEAQGRALVVSDPEYSIHLELDGKGETFRSETRIRFYSSKVGAESFVDCSAEKVENATLNGELLPADAFDGSRIVLKNLRETNELHVVARCRYEQAGVGMHRFVDPIDDLIYLYTDLEPFEAHRVYACFDQPDIKGTFGFSVVVPDDWIVISNCSPANTDDGRWEFPATPKISTYVTAVIAGPYHAEKDVHNGIDLGVYCRRSLAEYLDADEMLDITKKGLDFFSERYDYPYMMDTYDQIFVPEFNGGAMENFGAVTFNELYIFRSKVTDTVRERRADAILHEMAHMWFGDLVTMKWWEDLWLNESFATYESIVAQIETTRFTDGWTTFANGWKPWAYNVDQLPTTHPITTEMPDTDSVKLNFDGISYAKGCAVLRQLVAWVGDDAFKVGLRSYFRKHEYGNAQLEDFLAELSRASGRELSDWSKQWLEAAGVNTLRCSVEQTEDKISSFTIEQSAPEEWPTLRAHRLNVGLFDLKDGHLVRRGLHQAEVEGEATKVHSLIGEKVPDLLLLNDGDLTYSKIRLDARSLATLQQHLSNLGDPLARALCWAALWDMTRDAEMGARDYIQMVLKHAPSETLIPAVDSLLLKAVHSLTYFVHPSNRPAMQVTLANRALEVATQAEPRSDVQLAWFRAFITSATDEEHFQLARSLLSGASSIEGLSVDTDLRWLILKSLSAAGLLGSGELDDELTRDPSDAGSKWAAALRVAERTVDAKERAWAQITGNTELPAATLRAMMGSFHALTAFQPQHGEARSLVPTARHVEILNPFIERYFQVLPVLASTWPANEAISFTALMFPKWSSDEETLVRATRTLAGEELPGHVRRALMDVTDGLRRALEAQRKDLS